MTEVIGGPAEGPAPQSAGLGPDFRRLWLGTAASTFGSEVAELALPLLALVTLSASAGQVGLLRVAQFLPFLLVTLPLGVVVDRHRRHRLRFMVGADLGRFALVGSVPLAVWAGVGRIELLYGVVFASGVLTVLYQLADFAFLPSIVPADQLVTANGRIAGARAANEIGGRGLGGLLVQATSAPAAVAVNAATFLLSALSLRRIRPVPRAAAPPQGQAPAGPGTSPWREAVEGLRIAVGHRYMRALLGMATTYNIFSEVFLVGLMLYAVRDLGMSPAELGLVLTGSGVGSFAGSWFGSRVAGRFGYGRVLLVTLAVGNSTPLAMAFADRFGAALLPLMCTVFVAMGVCLGVSNVHAVTLRQVSTPEHLRGRVNAAYRLVSWGAIPVGAALGGAVAAHAGSHTAVTVGAAGVASATLWVALSAVPRLRLIEDAAAEAVPSPHPQP